QDHFHGRTSGCCVLRTAYCVLRISYLVKLSWAQFYDATLKTRNAQRAIRTNSRGGFRHVFLHRAAEVLHEIAHLLVVETGQIHGVLPGGERDGGVRLAQMAARRDVE